MKKSTLQLTATVLYATSGVCTAFILFPYGLILSFFWAFDTILSVMNYKFKRLEEKAQTNAKEGTQTC